eukprot:CAMPEP_0172640988 /NCGR_PEP_ID=MMETSP1068-20121228/225222_1 /TAXON_ID=35684 /ORGANISM="Pseudopedinella elastica, Strain CCMP716" /LENGTH=78 /DNA_ID=CAMNT_0013454463 /DNA_START=67 /DNA_END=300 /DNA_ORIENTATION=+
MSFEEGIRATDAAEMRRAGIDTSKAAELIGRAWLVQTFKHGFVHCDPHAGNVLVRLRNKREPPRDNAAPQAPQANRVS